MKCAIYARYSSELQSDNSIDDQIRNCRQFAENRGWVIEDGNIYSDRALSGTTIVGRTGLSNLMKAAATRPHLFDYVLIDDTSRLSRDRIEQMELIRDLKDLGINIYFVSDGIDTKDETTEDVILPVYGIKDSLYCRDLAKKTKRGMIGQLLQGYNPGGRTYGYKYFQIPDPSGVIDKKTRQPKLLGTGVEVDTGQAMVVKTIFSLYASGYGLKSITARLNEQNVAPPGEDRQKRKGHDKPSWCPNAVRAILRNSKYIGDWTWNKHKWIRKRKTGKRNYLDRPKEEWVSYENPNLAIVDRDLWQTVQMRIEKHTHEYRSGNRSPKKNYLMSGLLKCGVCGAKLIIVKCKGTEGYRCSFNWHRGAKVCPNNVTLLRKNIENRVIEAIKSRVLNPDIVSILVEKVNRIIKDRLDTFQQDRRELLQRRRGISDEIQNLIRFIAESGTASPSIQEAIKVKEIQLSAIDNEIAVFDSGRLNKELKVQPDFIINWMNKLNELIGKDIVAARSEISALIEELSATPVEEDGQNGLMLSGKSKLEGILGVATGVSTLNNSGGGI